MPVVPSRWTRRCQRDERVACACRLGLATPRDRLGIGCLTVVRWLSIFGADTCTDGNGGRHLKNGFAYALGTFGRLSTAAKGRFAVGELVEDPGSGPKPGSFPVSRQNRRLCRPASPLIELVGVAGLEPAAPASRRRCSTRLSYTPNGGRVSVWIPSRGGYCMFGGDCTPPSLEVCLWRCGCTTNLWWARTPGG